MIERTGDVLLSVNRCHATLKPCSMLRYSQPSNSNYQSHMLWAAKDTTTVVSTRVLDNVCQKHARDMEAFLVLQNLDAIDARTLTLYETAHINPSNKISHIHVLIHRYTRDMPPLWLVATWDKIRFLFLGGFSRVNNMCCGLLPRTFVGCPNVVADNLGANAFIGQPKSFA